MIKAYRGAILHFLDYPKHTHDKEAYQYFPDGLLIVAKNKIQAVGNFKDLHSTLPNTTEIIDYKNHLIMPGFIDTHTHYAQTEIIASFGQQLLEWLNTYVFPTEAKHNDPQYATKIADYFLEELLRNGTTTAAVFSTVHINSADTLFACADKLNMRIITGKTMMDRNAPEYLLDTPASSYADSKALIEKWHGKNRLQYALTPRFAPTSSEAQLEMVAKLKKEFPDTYIQTHISENKNEVKWVQELFPWSKNYTDVYDHYGLLGDKTILGHAVHISDQEFQRLTTTRSVISWCPTSNFFLGSGLFNLKKAREFNTRIGIGTDVGGGSSFSMLRTVNEAYKTAAVQGTILSPLESFYYLTLGNARALSLEKFIGNFESGKEADFIILDLHNTPLLDYKMQHAKTLEDKLFNLAILSDDRAVQATYINGTLRYKK
jgi:guanine deaminase